MPVLCELRFPSNKKPPSNFNRFLNLYSGYFFGNYYNNGNLSIDFEGSPLELTSILYDKPNPNPAMYGDFLMGFNYDTSRFYNLVFSNLSINLVANKISFSITYDFDVFPWESIDTLSFGFSSPSNSVGLCFYISNPKSALVTPFWIQHRLIIASFPPFTNTILPSPLDPDGIFDFTGNLAKYHQLSTLDLPSGATVDITIFSVSVYGQSHQIGTFPATIE